MPAADPPAAPIWFDSLLELADVGVAVLDPERRIRAWNPRAAAIVGWSNEEVAGLPIDTVLCVAAGHFAALLGRLCDGQGLRHERLNGRRRGHRHLRLTVSATAVHRPDGGLDGYLVQFHDDVSAAISDELRKFFQAVDQSLIGALIATPDGRIEYVNARACEMLDCAPRALVGTLMAAGGGADRVCPLALDTAAVAGGDWRGEVRVDAGSRGERTFYVAVSAIRDAAGDLANLVALFEDISEQRALQRAERKLRETLAHAGRLAAIGEMASVIAHEVNQPLAAIANFSRGCIRRIDDGQRQIEPIAEALGEIARQVERASAIIQNVRRFVRRDTSHQAAVDLDDVLRPLLPLFKVQANAAGARFEFASPGRGRLPPVLADATQISQIVLNLVMNGLEAMSETPPGERRLVVRLAAGGPGQVVVAVGDHGSGIPERLRERLGEPFLTTRPDGLGLGLSIARGLLEAHDSRLHCEANLPRGTTFSFALSIAAS